MLRLFISALKRLLITARSARCRRKERAMRLCETLPLGERRYLALVLVENQKFLVGAAGNSISLLARLPTPADGEEFLKGVEPDALFDSEEVKSWR